MLDLSKIDLLSFVLFLLPGLMLVQGFELGRHTKPRAISKDDLVVYPVFGLLYNLTLLSLGYSVQTGASISTIPSQYLILTYVCVPIFVGVLFGISARLGFGYAILKALGVKLDDPAPPIRTPWPVIAPKITVGTYVMVILKDKTIYRALVTEDSQLSSDQDKIDLYLGQTFLGEEWVPSNPQRAVYIRGSEIQSIEIWKFEESTESTEP
jgi:hypothetical protein